MTITPPAPTAPTAPGGTRAAIARSARRLFAEGGFAGTSVRAIAAGAGVDPALVIRHFTSKEQLFVEVMGSDRRAAPDLDGPLETLGAALAAHVLDPARDAERRAYAAMVQASDHDAVRTSLRAASKDLFVDRLARRLSGPDATLRAELIVAQIGGLLQGWTAIEPLIEESGRARVVALVGAVIQSLIDAPTD